VSNLVDLYSLRARRMPVLLVVLPAFLLLAVSILDSSTLGIASGSVASALSILGAQLGRDRGRNLQPSLWREWGGPPTTQVLRFSGPKPAEQVAQAHGAIEEVLSLALPSEDEERADPSAADERYGAAIIQLIAKTRDYGKFPLVFEENVNYGFRRNSLGLRRFGIAVCVVTLFVSILLLACGSESFASRAEHFGWPAAASILLGVFWLGVVSPDWVRVPADAYAGRLIEAAYTLA
jgi:ABC-type transport system involved in multi-copper enzyme maturation permease subunit